MVSGEDFRSTLFLKEAELFGVFFFIFEDAQNIKIVYWGKDRKSLLKSLLIDLVRHKCQWRRILEYDWQLC